MRKAVFVVLAILASVSLVGAPAAADDIPVVPPGCVLTGGGVVCGAGTPTPPAEAPEDPDGPVDITTVPTAPTFVDECGIDRDDLIVPADTDQYVYDVTRVAVTGQPLNDATVSVSPREGFVFSDAVNAQFYTGAPLWDHSYDIGSRRWTGTEFVLCEVAAPAPSPSAPSAGAPVVPDELAATGPSPWLVLLAAGGVGLVACGAVLARRAARR